MGMLAYLQTLGLNDQDMYDAQGNSFDPQAVCLRLQLGVQMWAAGTLERRHDYPRLQEVQRAYAQVLAYVRERGLVGCESPFPYDLRGWLTRVDEDSPPSLTPPICYAESNTEAAAEDGRRVR